MMRFHLHLIIRCQVKRTVPQPRNAMFVPLPCRRQSLLQLGHLLESQLSRQIAKPFRKWHWQYRQLRKESKLSIESRTINQQSVSVFKTMPMNESWFDVPHEQQPSLVYTALICTMVLKLSIACPVTRKKRKSEKTKFWRSEISNIKAMVTTWRFNLKNAIGS